MIKNFYIIAFTILCSYNLNAQIRTTSTINEYNLQNIVAESQHVKFTESTTNNNEYFNSNFILANVSGFKEKENLRYNALLDQFEYIRDGYLYKMDKISNQIITYDNGRKFKLVDYIDGKELKNRYLEVLVDGPKYFLYKKYLIDFTDGLGASGLNSSNKKQYFNQEKLLLGFDNKLHNIPSSTKKINELIGTNVQDLIKTNNLNIKKEQDLILLVELLNK